MYKYVLLWALCLGAPHVLAGELVDLQAESIDLGAYHGVVYYTVDHGRYQVVTTIAQGETGLPVRFEATITETQKLSISVPGKLGEKSQLLEISRIGDKLFLAQPSEFPNNKEIIIAEPAKTTE